MFINLFYIKILQLPNSYELKCIGRTLFNFCFSGVGYGMVIISGIVCVYYNIIITWTLYFLYMSFRAVLPWSSCDNSWNTENCYLHSNNEATDVNSTSFMWNATSVGNMTHELLKYVNTTDVLKNETVKQITPSEEFWE